MNNEEKISLYPLLAKGNFGDENPPSPEGGLGG